MSPGPGVTCPNAIACACASAAEVAGVPANEAGFTANRFGGIDLHASGAFATPEVLAGIPIGLRVPTPAGETIATGWLTTGGTVDVVVAAPSGRPGRRPKRTFGSNARGSRANTASRASCTALAVSAVLKQFLQEQPSEQ